MISLKIDIAHERDGAKIKTRTKKFQCPTDWDEITFEQYIQMMKVFNSHEDIKMRELLVLSIFTGISATDWAQATADQQNIIFECLKFLNEAPKIDQIKAPKHFIYKDNQYPIPRDLEQLTYRQMVTIQGIFQIVTMNWEEQKKNEGDKMPDWWVIQEWPRLVAYGMQPIIDGVVQVDEARAEELANDFKQMPVLDIYPIANFFFAKTLKFKLHGVKDLQETTKEKKEKPILKGWRSLGRYLRRSRSRGEIPRSLKH